MTAVKIHGYAHGDTVFHLGRQTYGTVHAYGVLTARGHMAEVRWQDLRAGTEGLTARMAGQLVLVSVDLPRAVRPHLTVVPTSFPDGVSVPRVTPRKTRTRHPQTDTEHTCNGGRGPHYGRKTRGCPRCEELMVGHPPRTWGR